LRRNPNLALLLRSVANDHAETAEPIESPGNKILWTALFPERGSYSSM
jgi:hypothetical protein